jgi:integrase
MASISKRKDGKWLGQVNSGGKRKSFYGNTKKEVESKISEYLNDINTYGAEMSKVNISIEKLMHTHLFVNVKPRVSLGTFERYMSLYNTHIKDSTFGGYDAKVTIHNDVQKFINSKSDLSNQSISMIKYLLHQSFNHAIANNIIRVNPVAAISPPRSTYKEKAIDVLTIDEQAKFMSVLSKTHYELLFVLELNTGMRVGEITALRWENVDLDNQTIKVRETKRLVKKYDNDGNSQDIMHTKEPKSKSGSRDIPIHKNINKKLKELKINNGASKDDFVFLNTNKEQIKYDSISKAQKMLCKKAKIREVTFHCLRHTFATRLIENGEDIKTVSQLLGHSKADITINRYVHSTANTKIQAIDKLYTSYNAL